MRRRRGWRPAAVGPSPELSRVKGRGAASAHGCEELPAPIIALMGSRQDTCLWRERSGEEQSMLWSGAIPL